MTKQQFDIYTAKHINEEIENKVTYYFVNGDVADVTLDKVEKTEMYTINGDLVTCSQFNDIICDETPRKMVAEYIYKNHKYIMTRDLTTGKDSYEKI